MIDGYVKQKEREATQIRADVENFVATGGSIQVLPARQIADFFPATGPVIKKAEYNIGNRPPKKANTDSFVGLTEEDTALDLAPSKSTPEEHLETRIE